MDQRTQNGGAAPRSRLRHVLLDRDGTIIVERGYLGDPAGVQLEENAAAGLALMQRQGRKLIVITNQSGVGRGYFDLAQLERVHVELNRQLGEQGVRLAGIYFCPHLPAQRCQCRKPAPGMVLQAAADFGFEPRDCVVVGDKDIDIELGRRVGALTIRVTTGYGANADGVSAADYTVSNLLEAARIIAALEADRAETDATRGSD